jgi:ATP-binding cassette subfamily F protein uup
MPLVALEHISHAYGHLPLLDDAALQVDAGERIAIIGRNGAGKSTLLQIIAADLPRRPWSGKVSARSTSTTSGSGNTRPTW